MKKVIFISAGPGDPDLITIKAINHLKKSEVVLVDRLVSPEIVNKYLNPRRKIIYVGKYNDMHNKKEKKSFFTHTQKSINHLMVYHALKGRYVVRLKGGDVSIFSNIMDELMELKKYDISYEIIPGVTAAIGASAYTGIPLTARGYASSVRFVTLHNPNSIDKNQWNEFMETKDTLVFYMCVHKLYHIMDKLMMNKRNLYTDKLIAIVEQATTPMQKVYTSTLYNFKDMIKKEKKFLSPSLVIFGKIVNLYSYFKWNYRSNFLDKKNYFIY
ncbi:uroporphyrinogen-III C-methyltransferase [Blattabacterium sp. (Cryptocercus kyebangensis)]|uniref:uroporphyrinogen-III C-methyltransferase n=1 Tax=Blattabacterium sp. (Cryptocercus kyebangensis) TaxID=298656 RepID=UPI000D7C6D1E|nr:uroporphyrinogen-III C-methyltransferase [Blattabacterium sp. (Cryptocercus kyebangensis)]AWU43711.1 uroporphyrinogen-III C-methyltransferase [Blattabacterium sp. (Cryptocercus kyebangensis)]